VTDDVLLRVEALTKWYPIKEGAVLKRRTGDIKAVNGVSFTLGRGETLGLVGESGCGKSTLARTLIRLEQKTDGAVYYRGREIFEMSRRELKLLRRNIQIIFQDPYSSLNPRMTVRDIVTEPWKIHADVVPKLEHEQRAKELLDRVGLDPDYLDRYPHQFSGGQRQRIGIARALALEPEIIICDEPVSALDVSVQAQVINLLEDLSRDLGIAYIFIAHDISVVRHISHRVAVMYMGEIVECGDEAQVFTQPSHPYTQALLSAVPIPDPEGRGDRHPIVLEGDLPSPADLPSGCSFRTRCWKAQDVCAEEAPDLVDRSGIGHPSRCHFAEITELI
jgi:oligopeptide transport system ATP-binding protein